MKNWLRRKLIHWLVKDLFCAVTADDLLQIHRDKENLNPVVWYKGKELTLDQQSELVQSAKEHSKLPIEKFLNAQIEYEAQRVMYVHSSDFGGMMFGKAALWILEQRKQAIENIKNL